MVGAYLFIFGASFLIALSGAMMPGPLLTATIGEASRRGFLAGPLLIVGHSLLELALLVALLLGLAPVLASDAAFPVIAFAGAGVLLWMGVGILRAVPRLTLSAPVGERGKGRLVLTGVLMSLANPYWSLWWATVGLACVTRWGDGATGVAAFYLGHIGGDFAWYGLVSIAVARGRRLLSDRLYRGLLAACAVFLIAFAGTFLWAGARRLIG